MDASAIFSGITLAALGLVAALLAIGKTGLEEGVKAAAKTGAENAVKDLHWAQALAQELEKTRGVERQESRFKSYSGLWKELRPLAIYDPDIVDRTTAEALSGKLSDWYFSESGGLLLTQPVRQFYFALQDLLRVISKGDDWSADRSVPPAELPGRFNNILQSQDLGGAMAAATFLAHVKPAEWPSDAEAHGEHWRADIALLAERWSSLTPSDKFVVLQQVGSILRTCMVNDVESRLR